MARVLIVVERDPELGEFLREALARIGHQTLMTTNAAQGLRLLESAAPDLVITNVLVRELDRLESFQRLYGRPGPKIIAISDHRDGGTASAMTERHSSNRILYKPFTETELIATVKSVLLDRLTLVPSLFHSGLQFDSRECSDRIGQQPGRILIIEDDPDIRELLIEVLESVGHEVLAAVDGTQGLQMLREEAPDLVLTDIMMPKMDGLELLQEIQSAESGSKIKTIAISGAPSPRMALKTAKDLGARETLAKPFTRREIIEIVDTVLAGDYTTT